MPKNIVEEFEALHDLTLDAVKKRLKDPECSAADLNIAIKFLKDNDMDRTTRTTRVVEDLLSTKNIPFESIEDTGT